MSDLTTGEPQFERMETREETAQSACAACQRKIPDVYFEAAGRIFCEACRDTVLASQSGGSSTARLLKALVFGTGAAVVSAVAWYAITELTNYQLGIVAIAVGFAVGFAVRAGSEQRGGWAYQAIAVLLTYLAIAARYVPFVMESFRAQSPGENETVVIVTSVLTALVLPVLQVTEGTGFIGLLIVGFALYEAWKLNKRQTIAFSGPFRLQRAT